MRAEPGTVEWLRVMPTETHVTVFGGAYDGLTTIEATRNLADELAAAGVQPGMFGTRVKVTHAFPPTVQLENGDPAPEPVAGLVMRWYTAALLASKGRR